MVGVASLSDGPVFVVLPSSVANVDHRSGAYLSPFVEVRCQDHARASMVGLVHGLMLIAQNHIEPGDASSSGAKVEVPSQEGRKACAKSQCNLLSRPPI